MPEEIKPITITVEEDGNKETIVLEFNKETVRFAEKQGFKPELIGDFPMTYAYDFVYYAMRMHNPRKSKANAEHLIDDVFGGLANLPENFMTRLFELWYAPLEAMPKDEAAKNAVVTVEM